MRTDGGRPNRLSSSSFGESAVALAKAEGRHYALAAALVALTTHDAFACPICFGASDAPMALGMNWGVLTLLGVTLAVLGSFAAFFVRVVRKSEQAEAGPHVAATGRNLA